jgi:hypothetical protein
LNGDPVAAAPYNPDKGTRAVHLNYDKETRLLFRLPEGMSDARKAEVREFMGHRGHREIKEKVAKEPSRQVKSRNMFAKAGIDLSDLF